MHVCTRDDGLRSEPGRPFVYEAIRTSSGLGCTKAPLNDAERYTSPPHSPLMHYCRACVCVCVTPEPINGPSLVIQGIKAGRCSDAVGCCGRAGGCGGGGVGVGVLHLDPGSSVHHQAGGWGGEATTAGGKCDAPRSRTFSF